MAVRLFLLALAFMARTGFQGFQTKDPFIEFGLGSLGSPFTFDTTIYRTGGVSLKHVCASGSAGYCTVARSSSDPRYVRFAVRFTVLPATERIFAGDGLNQNLKITPSGAVKFCAGSTVLVTSTTLLTDTSKWYVIQIHGNQAGTILSGETVLKVDSENCNLSSNWTSPSGALTQLGTTDTVAATYTCYYADFSADNATYPGDGYVDIMLPISDNNRGGWTGGVGGTANIFDAVNNTPPVGTATETDTTQIESATNSATDNCDLNMESYSTVGIAAGSTVNALYPVIMHGEDIATGTKSGAFQIISNPAEAGETSFTFGNDAGALNTHPDRWSLSVGSITSGPSVTLGTSPVMRVGKRTATTRVVSCEFMGIYVDWAPPAFVGDEDYFWQPQTQLDDLVVTVFS